MSGWRWTFFLQMRPLKRLKHTGRNNSKEMWSRLSIFLPPLPPSGEGEGRGAAERGGAEPGSDKDYMWDVVSTCSTRHKSQLNM